VAGGEHSGRARVFFAAGNVGQRGGWAMLDGALLIGEGETLSGGRKTAFIRGTCGKKFVARLRC